MEPGLEFVSAIKDAIFNKRKWGKFSTKRNAKLFGGANYLEGGSEGSLASDYIIQTKIQMNTNEYKRRFKIYIYIYNLCLQFKFIFIFIICIYNLYLHL